MPAKPWTMQFDQRIWFLLTVAWGSAYTVLAISIMPLLVHVWMRQLGLSEELVGYLASLGALGGAIGLFASGWLIARSTLPRIALLGLVISVICDVASIFAWDLVSLGIIRFVGGSGAGLALGAFVGWFARHQQSDRCFGLFALCQFAQGAAAMALMPWLESWLGVSAIYLCLIVFGIIGCGTAAMIGNESSRLVTDEGDGTSKPLRFTWRIVLVIAAGGLYNAFAFGLSTYSEIYGISLGYSKENIDFALAAGSIVGVPGTIFMIILGNRFGRAKPVMLSLTAFAAAIAILLLGKPPFNLLVTQYIITGLAWSFGYPYVQAIQAELDATGRVAIYGTVASAAGAVAGPSIFAMMLERGNFYSAFTIALVSCIACLFMLLAPAWRADQLQLSRELSKT